MQRAFWSVAAVAALGLLVAASAASAAADGVPTDPQQLARGLRETAKEVASDPAGTVSDPQGAIDGLLDPGKEEADEGAEGPEEGADPGFADRIRAAFQDEALVVGLTSLLVTGLGVAGLALVTRYVSPKEALKNPQRAMLYGFVRGNPGVHLKRLSDEFAMKTSSILWHIRKLESAELVRSERANGFRVFYPVDGGIEVKRVSRALAALQNRNALRLFEALDRHPGQAPAQLAERLAIHAGTVRWHLRKLRDYGLVEELVREDGSTYYGTSLGRRALQTLVGSPVSPSPLAAPVAAPVLE